MFQPRAFISFADSSCQRSNARFETFSKMRWPSAPGNGGASSPGSSCPSFAHWTIRCAMYWQYNGPPMPALRTIVLGMRGTFTAEALRAPWSARGCGVSGLVVPGPQGHGLAAAAAACAPGRRPAQRGGAGLGRGHSRDRGRAGWTPPGLRALDALEPDVVAIACFPVAAPAAVARPAAARAASTSIPSLLPAYRGPAPLFWQFRAGETRTGRQPPRRGRRRRHRQRDRPGGGAVPGRHRHRRRGDPDRPRGRAPPGGLAGGRKDGRARRSPPRGAFRNPAPDAAARVVPTTWPVRRAFNFIRGAPALGAVRDGHRARSASPSTRRWPWTRRRRWARPTAPPAATCCCSSRTAFSSRADRGVAR